MRLRRFAPFFVVMSLALVPFVLPARGAAPAASRTVDVEVVEIARDKSSHTLRVAVSLVDNDGASEVSTQAGTFRYFLEARRDRRAGGSPVLALELQRADTAASGDMRLSAASFADLGQRVVIGRVERPDGTATEIAATLR